MEVVNEDDNGDEVDGNGKLKSLNTTPDSSRSKRRVKQNDRPLKKAGGTKTE